MGFIVFLGLAETSSYAQEYEEGSSETVSLIYENSLASVYRLPPKETLEKASEKVASLILQQLAQKGLANIITEVTSVLVSKLGGLFLTFITEMPEVGIPTRVDMLVLAGNDVTNAVQTYRDFLPLIIVAAGDCFDYGILLTCKHSAKLFEWEVVRQDELLDLEELSALYQKGLLRYGDRFLVLPKEPLRLPIAGKYRLVTKAWCESEGNCSYELQVVEVVREQLEYTYPSRTSPSATVTTLYLSELYGDKNTYQKCFTTTAPAIPDLLDPDSMKSDFLAIWLEARTQEFEQFNSKEIYYKAWVTKMYHGLRACSDEKELLNKLPDILYHAFAESEFSLTSRLSMVADQGRLFLLIKENGEYKFDSEFPHWSSLYPYSNNKNVQYELTKYALELIAKVCRNHYQTHDFYPLNLEELKDTPVEIASVPLAEIAPFCPPFTLGEILSEVSYFGTYHYFLFDDGFIVYSPGPDQDDDGASIEFTWQQGFGSDGDIVLASSPDVYQHFRKKQSQKALSSGLVYIRLNEQGYEEYRNLKDDSIMVKIPAGEFLMGSTEEQIVEVAHNLGWSKDFFKSELPLHKVYLDAYYIDKYEVTSKQFKQFIEATGYITDIEKQGRAWWLDWRIEGINWRHPEGPQSNITVWRMNYPVVYVTLNDARAYAKWAGKRLPTEAEWEKASRGNLVEKLYPWGDKYPNGNQCNFADKNTDFDWSDKTFDDGYKYNAPVGKYVPNSYGLYDIAGNVWEWCSDLYDGEYYSHSPYENPHSRVSSPASEEPDEEAFYVVRGGAWASHYVYLRSAHRGGVSLDHGGPNLGFRCAKSVE